MCKYCDNRHAGEQIALTKDSVTKGGKLKMEQMLNLYLAQDKYETNEIVSSIFLGDSEGNEILLGENRVKITYCPMCGRKLNLEAQDEDIRF